MVVAHAQEAPNSWPQGPVSDPLESWNRSVFSFNRSLDNNVFKPVATVYRDVLPSPIQTGVGNFFANLREIWSAANNVFQLRPDEAFVNVTRVGINTTVGIYGVFDVATLMGIQPLPKRDFGETLGRWGVPAGPYLMLPVLGPSTLRDVSDDIVVAHHPTWSPNKRHWILMPWCAMHTYAPVKSKSKRVDRLGLFSRSAPKKASGV
jgi:ABC-type transporter lipoprotein component MlaA